MKTLSVVVTTPPSSYLTISALDFITSALASGVKIIGIFFYQDGVLNASANISIPNDEFQIHKQWEMIKTEHNVNLHVCISACEKRGLSDDINNDNSSSNITPFFTVSGLGELVELSTKAQRVVQF